MQANTPVTAPAVALPTLYQEVIHRTRYARWNSAAQRRENWGETVARYFDFFSEYLYTNHAYVVSVGERSRLEKAMLDLDIMPSMRALMTAGPALEAVQMANYNCTYTPIDDLAVFSEIMYILMTGSGVGFSVEGRYVSKLPAIPQIEPLSDEIILVGDSREGWCDALYGLLTALANGVEPRRDLSLCRPKGSRLKTFGGYSSGPEPLAELFDHVVATFRSAQGRQLSTVEVFSIATKIAQVVVVGGVRRSATIALFDKDDTAMLNVKGPDAQMYSVDADGKWSEGPNAHYAMANVSAVFEATPTREDFKIFWAALKDGQRGEPGIFNRDAFVANAVAHGRNVRDENGDLIHFGANPCCEIQLQPRQACNLTGVAIRDGDTLEQLKVKVELATILGTWQAAVTNFSYLRPEWKKNIEKEALLGTCLTGFYDHEILSQDTPECARWLRELRDHAIVVNKHYAATLGINAATSVTSVKPAGNSGELYDTASGIHPRRAPYYIRRIRQTEHEPMTAFLAACGFPMEVDSQKSANRVFSFPIKSPAHAVCVPQLNALAQLKHWLLVKKNWATHTVSCTINIGPEEWDLVEDWVYAHFDEITGLSFLPTFDAQFAQMPEEPVDEVTYNALVAEMPVSVDWELLRFFESDDNTAVSQEFTCVGGACTI